MMGLARIAAPIACLGLAVLLVSRTRRNRIAGLGYAAVGTVLLVASLEPASAVELAGALVGAVVLAPLLGALFRREPWLVAFATLAFVPLRVHFLGHQLLVPLYAVALGAAAALLWELVRGDERTRELGVASRPLALYLAWVGVSLGWTVDPRTAAIDVLAFYVPFTILALAIARLPWEPLRVKLLYGELMAMALVFAGVGFYQYDTRTITENPKLINSNSYAALFRVNSVFYDPSIYGRFLVVAIVASAVVIVRARSPRVGLAAAALAAVVWAGLLISFSQSSFSALLVAILVLAAIVWRWRSLGALALAIVVLGGIAVTQPKLIRAVRHHSVSTLNKETSGRASLIANGIRIFEAHPALGVGIGGFQHAYSERTHRTPRQSASHDTPVTVAAEEGAIGLFLFLWLVVAAWRLGFRRIEPSLHGGTALAAGLALVAVFVHSLSYNDFFEDPTMWGLLGLVALASPRRCRAQKPPPPVEDREPVPA